MHKCVKKMILMGILSKRFKKKLWKIPLPSEGGSARVIFHFQIFFGSKWPKNQF